MSESKETPKLLKIALLQIAPGKTLEENLEKGLLFCRKAREAGADIALFPEMWSNGYNIYNRPVEEWTAEAISADSAFVRSFGEAAKELNMAVGITLLEKFQGGPRNTLILFDRFGEKVLTYAKVHTCDFDVERNLTPGDDFYVAELDTSATCNYSGGVPDCNGGSSVFDGMVYLPSMEESRDTCILQAGKEEGVYLAELIWNSFGNTGAGKYSDTPTGIRGNMNFVLLPPFFHRRKKHHLKNLL